MRRLVFPILLGLTGVLILVALGNWQMRRLDWKTGVLNEIEAKIAGPVQTLPTRPREDDHEYLPVQVSGDVGVAELRVLVSDEDRGAGYRVIAPFVTEDGRRILVDRGYVRLEDEFAARAEAGLVITGNLLWPDEIDRWTPEPDLERGLWFARDVPAMAAALETEPVMVVVRAAEGSAAEITPLPVGTDGIANDHLEYAITWYALALVWAAMSGYLVVRTLRRKD